MTPKTKARKRRTALSDAGFKAALKRIDANLKRTDAHLRQIDRQNKEMEPLLRELRKIADE